MKNRLSIIRGELGLTQEQMADLLIMSVGGYRKIEYGTRHLSVWRAASIAEKLGRPISEVIGDGGRKISVANTLVPDDQSLCVRRPPSREEVDDMVRRFLEWDDAHREEMIQVLTLLQRAGSVSQ